ncbi:MAG TPA: PmoA family protein [Chitinophaga sp.]|uniref:DUF6807 domain-containing protein n=1 Tax=Chitinophaga sp. TaxID=1869181 RepID=UPI002DB61749|nr:PmoA family protein [Chitinophaga sp.]HEU4554010.1 PmoA family protein [Chitinophaga sp.]
MKKPSAIVLLLLIIFSLSAMAVHAQTLARITVDAGKYKRDHTPVSVVLDAVTALPDSALTLLEIKGAQRIPVPFQVEAGYQRRIWWILSGTSAPGAQRVFELVKGQGNNAASKPAIQAIDQEGTLRLQDGSEPILQYNYAMVYPPAGVDSAYKRSGFIHPLWAPNGAVLTNIHPKDHWHHVGIWNPWTDTEFEGKEVDFWNLYKKQGTVRFAGFLSKTQGPVWGGFKALQQHVVLQGTGAEKIALNEVWDVRAYPAPAGAALHVWDLTSVYSCDSKSPLLLKQYRYGGGFGFRATPEWTNATSQVLTSEGHTRKDADSTRARWVKITGQTSKGQAGMLVLSYPDNYDSPEPVRIWTEHMGDGQLFVNFSPTKMKPWLLTYGKEYTLKYRVVVYDNDITAAAANALWDDLAHPPVIKIEKR